MFFQEDERTNNQTITNDNISGGKIDFSSFEFETEETKDDSKCSSASDISTKKEENHSLKQVVYLVEKVNHGRALEKLTMKKVNIVKKGKEQKFEQPNNSSSSLSCKYSKIKDQGIIDDCDIKDIHLRNLNKKRNGSQNNYYNNDMNLKQTTISQDINNEITINTPNQVIKSNFICHDRSKIYVMKTSFDFEEKLHDAYSTNATDNVPQKKRIIWNAKEPTFDPAKNTFKFPLAGRYNRKSIGSKHNLVMENESGQITFIVRKVRKDAFEVEVSPLIPQEIVFGLAASAIVGPKTK